VTLAHRKDCGSLYALQGVGSVSAGSIVDVSCLKSENLCSIGWAAWQRERQGRSLVMCYVFRAIQT
jgi:hypothetical protein